MKRKRKRLKIINRLYRRWKFIWTRTCQIICIW